MQRIIDFGAEWAANGQKVGRKWADKELTIILPTDNVGQKVGRKWAGNGQKKATKTIAVEPQEVNADYQPNTTQSEKASSEKLYPKMVRLYDEFCHKRINVGAKMDALQGKSLKSIIEFLATQVKKKKGTITESEMNEGIVSAWNYILSNWDFVKGYYAEQIKLSQINANLPNILMQLKTSKSNNRDAKFNTIQNEIGNINFE